MTNRVTRDPALMIARNRRAALVRHHGVDDPRTVEATRALELAKLAAARARLAEQEAAVVAMLVPA